MPGPRYKKNRPKKKASPPEMSNSKSGEGSGQGSEPIHQSPPNHDDSPQNKEEHADASQCIESRWNGPRVLDVSTFVTSRHAVAPNMEDPSCAVYAIPEVCEMMLRVLPKDTALILWYNKSRKSARICPACRRYYGVGDILLPHLVDDQSGSRAEYVDPRNSREKRISGLCSLMCFGIASYNWPGSIGAWGKYESEIDAKTQSILLGSGANIADDGMGVLMKLSRMEDMLNVISETFRAGSRLY